MKMSTFGRLVRGVNFFLFDSGCVCVCVYIHVYKYIVTAYCYVYIPFL